MEILDRMFLDTPTRSVHAATIEFWKGYPVIAWFGGSREGAQDVGIYLYNLNGDHKTIVFGNQDALPRWNPILFAHEGRLYLFEKAGQFCDRWQTFIHDITDWSNDITEMQIRKAAKFLPAGLNGPVKTKPIPIAWDSDCKEGDLDPDEDYSEFNEVVCGSSVETFCDWTTYLESFKIVNGEWIFSERSKPLTVGKKLFKDRNGQTRASSGIIQPALWLEEGKLRGLARSSTGLNNLYYLKGDVDSSNEPIETNLPNPNSGVDVVIVGDRLFLVSNPSTTLRNPLVIQELKHEDDGQFEVIDEIVIREKVNDGDIRTCISQELSYPYMVENEGNLQLVYTYGRSRIEFVTISI